jgi:phosphoribosylformylglycinamidine synthase
MEAVAVGHGICPRLSDVDAQSMAACAVDEAVRNVVAVGADPDRLAGLDNFCWCDPVQSAGNPDGDLKAGQLVRAAKALYETCVGYGVPLISGKDSMKNDAVIDGVRISIPPTLLFSVVGKLDDARRAVSMEFKRAGDRVYVLGTTRDELAGSEYQARLGGHGGRPPAVRAPEFLALYRGLHRAILDGCLASCHDCSDGGLAVALAESAFAGGLGLQLDLRRVPAEDLTRDDLLLYSESAGRLVVSVPEGRVAAFERHLQGQRWAWVGLVTEEPALVITGLQGAVILREPIADLSAAWKAPLDF